MEIKNLGSESISYANIIVRVLGYTMISFGLTICVISIKSYRKGEKWAWSIMWIVPCFLFFISHTVYTSGGNVWIIEVIILLLAVITQVFAFFFPRNKVKEWNS